MCGIVAAVAGNEIVLILVEGLKTIEHRGHDSAGLAVVGASAVERTRAMGRVAELDAASLDTRQLLESPTPAGPRAAFPASATSILQVV